MARPPARHRLPPSPAIPKHRAFDGVLQTHGHTHASGPGITARPEARSARRTFALKPPWVMRSASK